MRNPDCFSVHWKDLMGRVGFLRTKGGGFLTPHMFPVADANDPLLSQEFYDDIGVQAVMTNAYLLRRARLGKEPEDVHDTVGFEGTVATDSGAYQILEYGHVGVEPKDIVTYQEEINTDIGVILDVPTGYWSDPARARWTVDETVRRADEAIKLRTRDDILWVGPIQGGTYLDEIARSAREMTKRNFHILALGSPTQVMESQHFELLVDMVISAKKNIPPGKPFHLFGAGHPSIFAFLVALGCDLFDSAAYALYARTGRYITPEGTVQLENMEEFPCLCNACRRRTPRDVRRLKSRERELLISQHNLQACVSELRKIREEIRKGRLWDLLEVRAQSHPAMRKCLNRIAERTDMLERYTPVTKPRGIFYIGNSSEARPELIRYRKRFEQSVLFRSSYLLLLPGMSRRPFREDPRYRALVNRVQDIKKLHVCFYSVPFGPVPLELDETFPIAQTECLDPEDFVVYKSRANMVRDFVKRLSPRMVFLAQEGQYGRVIFRVLSKILGLKIYVLSKDELKPDRLPDLLRGTADMGR